MSSARSSRKLGFFRGAAATGLRPVAAAPISCVNCLLLRPSVILEGHLRLTQLSAISLSLDCLYLAVGVSPGINMRHPGPQRAWSCLAITRFCKGGRLPESCGGTQKSANSGAWAGRWCARWWRSQISSPIQSDTSDTLADRPLSVTMMVRAVGYRLAKRR